MTQARYRQIYQMLKLKIQQGEYEVGDMLPSENELCRDFSITRTTARRALDELVREGFIERSRGRRSRVVEGRKSLGLLSIKGFSEAAGSEVQTVMLTPLQNEPWPGDLVFAVSDVELGQPAIYFRRLRKIKGKPVSYESNWFAGEGLKGIMESDFVEGSFFKTLRKRYLIEITGASQELYAIPAEGEVAEKLEISKGAPVLRICIKFTTSKPHLNIYARLFCNTELYPIGNSYHL